MSIQNKVEINGKSYTFYTMPPTEAFPLLFHFFKTFGKPLAPLIAHEEAPTDAVIGRFIDALSQAEAPQALQLFRDVFKYVRQEGHLIELDEHFSGRNKDLLKVFFYALVFNFSDFLDAGLLTFVSKALTS